MIVRLDRRADFAKAIQLHRCVDFEFDFAGFVISN